MSAKRPRWPWGVGALSLLAGAAAWMAWGRGRLPEAPPVEVPQPAQVDALDSRVASLVRDARDRVLENRSSYEAWMHLGMVYEANGLFDYALPCYEHARTLPGADARVYQRLAATHERVSELGVAIEAMTRAAELDPAFAPAHWQLGLWLVDTGQLERAQAHLERALELEPRSAPAWFGMVRLHLARRENDRAVTVLQDRGLLRGPGAAYAHQLLATAYRQMGRPDDAQAAIDRAGGRPAAPGFSALWSRDLVPLRAGHSTRRRDALRLKRAGRVDEAIAELEALVAEDPGDLVAMNFLADSYLEAGRRARAIEVLESVLAADPADYYTNRNLARVLGGPTADPATLDRALALLDTAILARPFTAGVRQQKAHLLQRMGRPDEAIAVLKTAYEQDVRDPLPLVQAGELELKMRRWADARATFTRIVEAHPRHGAAMLGLARGLMELGELDRATELINQAAALPEADGAAVSRARARLELLRAG